MKTYIPFLFVGAMGLAFANQSTTRSNMQALGTGKPLQAKNLGTVSVSATKLKPVSKPAKRFSPRMLTSTTFAGGTPVDPNLKVSVQGGSAKASELVDGTNSLESTLNGLGSSLYDDENDTRTPLVKLDPVVLNLSSQANRLASAGGMKGNTPVAVTRDVSAEINSVRTTPMSFSGSGSSAKATLPSGTVSTSNRASSEVSMPPSGGNTGGNKGGAKGGKRGGKVGSKAQNNLPGAATQTSASTSETVVIPKTVDKKYTLLNESYGDPDWFSIDLDASLTKHADMKLRKVTANADINAFLIGKKMSLFHAKIEAGGTRDLSVNNMVGATGAPRNPGRPGGRRQAQGGGSSSSNNQSITTMEATLVGDDLFSPVSKTTSGKIKKNLTGRNVNWEYSIKIPIIPTVNAVGTVGVKGSMGVDLVVNSDSSGGDIKLKPKFDTSIYAEGGVEVSLIVASVEGGLGAELTLLDYDLNISAGVTPALTNVGSQTYYAASSPITVSHSMESLSGRMYGFARVSYWLPFKTREKTIWDGNLFKWNGFTDSRTLLSEDTEAVIIGKSPIPMAEATISLKGN